MNKKRRRHGGSAWSVTHIRRWSEYPGLTLRVAELKPAGTLQLFWKRTGQLQKSRSLQRTRADLGATPKEQREAAISIAREFFPEIAKLEADGKAPLPAAVVKADEVLTLGRLVDLYEQRGSLQAEESYRREQTKKLRVMAAFLGPEKLVASLSESDVNAWINHRRHPGEEGRKVRQNTIAGDLHALNIALNFAYKEKCADGSRLLKEHPLPDLVIEKEKNPRRPIADPDRYAKLKKVARGVSPVLDLVLDLLWESGHRIGAILGLRWQNILFEPTEAATLARELESEVGWTQAEFALGGIHYYEGRRANNKSYPHVRPILTPETCEALERVRKKSAAIAGAWLFADPRDASQPLKRWVLHRWLREAERKAKLPHLKGGAFHPFRRAWATRWKDRPDVDAALMGGWKDVETKNRSYTKSDVQARLAFIKAG